jgi:ketosteroid isomerase-like protein
MTPRGSALLLPLAVLSACGQAPAPDREAQPDALAPYVEFLERGATDPSRYILDLFDDHDLVVLCERWHPEMTQYELFHEVVADPRFGREVGQVFTELGGRNLQPGLDAVMSTPGLDEAGLTRALLPIYRDLGLHPYWDSTNFFDFIRRVYRLNAQRPEGERVRLHLSDVELDWAQMTAEAYAAFSEEVVPERDRRMADAIIDGFRRLEAQGGRPAKALVIMNYRHAFNDFVFDDGSKGDNVGRYLFEAFPGRVANVMLSSVALLPGTTDREAVFAPMQDGRWDAAFRAAGIREAAFDFAGSPFGDDPFDYFAFRPHSATYSDVFTGFVFWRPLSEHYLQSGVPGLFEDGFADEVRRRLALTGRQLREEALAESIAASDEPVREGYDEPERLEASIAKWLAHSRSGIAASGEGDDTSGAGETLSRFMDSLNRADWDALAALLAPEATIFFPLPDSPYRADGIDRCADTFRDFFEAVRSRRDGPPYTDLQPEDVRIQTYGPTAVVSFHLKNPAVCSRRTLVLERRGDRWLIVHLHASNVRLDDD